MDLSYDCDVNIANIMIHVGFIGSTTACECIYCGVEERRQFRHFSSQLQHQ